MNKLTQRAFEKMQKREHFLRVARDKMALGRITREVFRQQEAQIIEKYQLTDDEQRAYDQYNKLRRKGN